MLSLLATAACLVSSVLAQTPPSYTLAKTNNTLGLKYGSVSVKAGDTLPYKGPFHPSSPPLPQTHPTNFKPSVPTYAPTLSTTIPLNTSLSYIAIIVDTTANLSSPIPASLVWFQQDVTFAASSYPTASIGSPAQVPYATPTSVGHAYLALLYAQPPGFIIPPDFPYTNTFRSNFNVSRVAVDFKTPLLEANWFVLGSNCTDPPKYTASSGFVPSTGFATGTHGPYPSKTAVYVNGARGRF